ncbi:ATP-binding protein [Pontibacter arcticus]|uniref:histidine kinase n=1 Tax=Pontibacter arcticus TaxID=2080288 RepID=A0A364RJA1_9BACT|nr:ATP-binding protein [Pontibacter arcticus]RAU84379.1 histidine kinase [Pontibacter arcticus]
MRIFKDSTKSKVVVGFATALGIVVFAIYLTYSSFTQLLNSLDVLSQPNNKLRTLRHTLATMATAESTIRAYTLTSQERHFNAYLSHLDTIRAQVDTLHIIMTASPTELAEVDSIRVLLDRKEQSLLQYADLKKQYKTQDISKEALRRIAYTSSEKPAPYTIRKYTTTTISDLAKPAGEAEEELVEENPESKEVKKTLLGRLFSKRRNQNDNAQQVPRVPIPKLDVRQETTIDTSKTNQRSKEKVADLANVRRILSRLQREADRKEQELLSKELALLHQDKRIMDQIRNMVYKLERHELVKVRERSGLARKEAKETSSVLLAVGIFGLVSGIAFILFILRDITRSNKYKSQLIGARKQAIQLARAKEAFVANMSHEMRTPLNVILGFARQLKHAPLEAEQTEHLRAIDSAGHHLLHIVNDVLDLSKIEAGKLDITPVTFSLKQLATDIEQAFFIKATSKHIHFEVFIDHNLPDALTGDALRIKQILFNLVDNAIKFTHEGQVQVKFMLKSIRRSRVVLSIAVTDTGIGIAPERMQHVFGEFNQADDSILRKYGGTGLGLSISQKLVEMQGGTLAVNSVYNKGTTFNIVLPLLKATTVVAATAAPKLQLPLPQAFAGYTALVIDDDTFSQTLSNLILSRWGIKVHLASDATEALALVNKYRFDIILTDIQLPGMSGKSLARLIRKQDKHVPIIALTANIMSNDAAFFHNTPISGHLLKPFTEQELYQKLAEILEPQPATEPYTPLAEKTQNQANALYNLSDIRKFTGTDTETLVAVLDVMCQDQYTNLEQLLDAKDMGNWTAAAEVAHKMLTAFKHLKADSVVPYLSKLEQELHQPGQSEEELEALAESINDNTFLVLEALEEEIAQLKSMVKASAS